MLALVATGLCRNVRRLSFTEAVDSIYYNSPATYASIGIGGPAYAPGLAKVINNRTLVFINALEMMAEALQVALDGTKFDVEFGTADAEPDLGYMTIPRAMSAASRCATRE